MPTGLRRRNPETVAELRSRIAALEVELAAAGDGAEHVSEASDAERLVRFLPEAVMVQCGGRLVFVNDATLRLLGAASVEDLIGREILDFIPAEERSDVRERTRKWRDARSGAAPLRHKSLGLDGTVVDVETTALAIDWHGQSAMLLVSRDRSERVKTETALQESEERYRGLVELLPDAVYIHNGKAITFINPSGVRMFGAETADQIVGRAPLDFSHPAERGYVVERSSEILKRNVGKESQRRRRLRLDGSEYLADVAALPLKWHGESAVLVVVQDVTEQVRAQEELRRSNAELEQFAYVASHDLQEPLRTVASYCQLLERRYKDKLDQSAMDYIGFAVAGAKRMQLLISDLLQFSRVGTRGKEFTPTDCGEVFSDAVSNLHQAIVESGAQVTCDKLPVVIGDRVQLGQLFQNLMGNAIKFRGERVPVIHVGALVEGSDVVLSVRDNGIGIDPQHRERIFQIFQRLHERDKYPGTGIGLAVCKKIVERHGGRIWVEGAPDEGSTFLFSLPIAP